MYSMYVLFDTIFIGQRFGELGLSALNISIPIYNLLYGIGLLIGAGGSTVLSTSKGMSDEDSVNRAFEHSIILGLLSGLILTVIGLLFIDEIANFLGASSTNKEFVIEYLIIILFFSTSFIMQYVLSTLVRNDNSPRKAMIAMGIGGISNIVLDYLFIFPLDKGMRGAALATALSSLISVAILLSHFVLKKSSFKFEKIRLQFNLTYRISKIGLSSFITEVTAGLLIFFFNFELLKYYGDIGVSAYSIIANISLMLTSILTGVSLGMQPIISINYGAKKFDRVDKFKKIGVAITVVMGCLFLLIGQLFPERIIYIFTKETGSIIDITIAGIRYYFLAFPFMGFNIPMSGYYQAIEYSRYSTIISTIRGMFSIFILLNILTNIIGSNGIWLTTPIVEVIAFISVTIITNFVSRNEMLAKEIY